MSQNQTMTQAQMQAEIEKLRAENEKLKTQSTASLGLKVAPKGGISLIGLRGFPTTFYPAEWEQILAMGDKIREFAKTNAAALAENQANPKASNFQARKAYGA